MSKWKASKVKCKFGMSNSPPDLWFEVHVGGRLFHGGFVQNDYVMCADDSLCYLLGNWCDDASFDGAVSVEIFDFVYKGEKAVRFPDDQVVRISAEDLSEIEVRIT